jgi:hypothetical protein
MVIFSLAVKQGVTFIHLLVTLPRGNNAAHTVGFDTGCSRPELVILSLRGVVTQTGSQISRPRNIENLRSTRAIVPFKCEQVWLATLYDGRYSVYLNRIREELLGANGSGNA